MEGKKSKISGLMVLMVFCMFAVCLLAVLLTGAGVYQRLVERQQDRYEQRTAARYLTTRLHQSDRKGGLRVADFQGHSTLIFREEIEGSLYETCIYCCDGYVRELFVAAGSEEGAGYGFSPQDGEKILEAGDLIFTKEGSRIRAQIVFSDGTSQELFLQQRSEGEAWE